MNFIRILISLIIILGLKTTLYAKEFDIKLIKNNTYFPQNNTFIKPKDLTNFPQDVKYFLDKHYNKTPQIYKNTGSEKIFKKNIMKSWNIKGETINIEEFNKNIFAKFETCYGLSFQKYNKDTIFDIKSNAANYKQLNKNAIITKHSDLRLTPSDLPCFHPDKPGGAFPFDDYQNSRLYIGSPIKITAISNDKNWYLVYSHETSIGWIKTDNAAFINHADINFYKKHKLGVILEDRENLKIGMFLPIHKHKKNELIIHLPKKSNNKNVHWQDIKIRKSEIAEMPITFNKTNISKILNSLLNRPYGWGGMDGERDCSMTTKDYFATLGIFLKRNSRAQSYSELAIRSYNLKEKTNEEKIKEIKNIGIPFKTLLFLPGHIGLYIGEYDGTPSILHNIWGIRIFENTEHEGRNIIGKSIISSLEIGKELDSVNKTLLDKLERITVL